jgi:hypothetical protein
MFLSTRRVAAVAVAVIGAGVLGAPTASATPVSVGIWSDQCLIAGTDFPQSYVSAGGGASFDLPETVYQGERVEIEASVSGKASGAPIQQLIDAGATTIDGSSSATIYLKGIMNDPVRMSINVPGLAISQGSSPGASWSGKTTFVLPTADVGTFEVYSGGGGSSITARKADGSLTKYGETWIGCPASPYFPKVAEYRVLPAVQHGDLSVTGTTRVAKSGADTAFGPSTLAVDHDRRTNTVTGTLAAPPKATIPFKLFGSIPATATVKFTPGPVTGKLDGGVLTAETPLAINVSDFSIAGIPIVSGSTTCKANTTAKLASGQGFSLTAGGSLSGEYAIPALTGCGPFTSLVDYLVSGGGNTLSLTAGLAS